MHRAQKASSKLCHDREVEKAQEIHKRKIDGVKSYLTAITRPPAPTVPESSKTSKPSTFFRRSLRQHVSAPKDHQAASHSDIEAKPSFTDDHIGTNSDEDDIGGTSNDEGSDDGNSCGNDEVVTGSFGKLDELRSVLVPVMAYKGHKSDPTELDYERYLDAITNPPPSAHEPPKPEPIHQSTHSLRASAFRMRRLKQIENDNLTIFERIKNSTAHYRTDSLKKDWDQNVAYLTSICAFPVVEEALHAPARRTTYARKRSPFAPRLPDQLPSLQLDSPPVVHPIKAIPTSPKKANTLNLSPAFRSLRKGLPQVPALPPLTASPRSVNGTKVKSMTAVATSRSAVQIEEPSKARSSPMTRSPSPPTRTESAEGVADDPSRYTLLKIGRFVGGKYLVLTVYSGDGITNPYGFDVVAMDPETHVEFHLSITKETTHLLLETISSSTMAERTAAAAGTNLSMELIARCICDHIRYAQTGNSEIIFLVATVGNPGGLSNDAGIGSDEEQLHHSSHLSGSDNASLLLDTMYSAMAFCLHQYVQISTSASDDSLNVVYAHVFASTRPQKCCQSSMRKETPHATTSDLPAQSIGGVYNGLVCFEVCEEREEQRSLIAQLLVSVSEVIKRFEDDYIALDSITPERLSLDRFLMLSLQFLHLRPAGGHNEIQLVLTPSQPNEWMSLLQPPAHSPCRPSSTMLPSDLAARIQHHVSSHQIVPSDLCHQHKLPTQVSAFDEIKNVLQTGMLWRGVYLFARIVLVCPGSFDETSGQVSRKPSDELLVFNILNTSTGKYSERVLHGDQVEALSKKLGTWQSTVGDIPPLVVFAKLLLLRMRLDVDLRGQEIILFPTLEPRYHNAGGGCSSPKAASRRNSPVKQTAASDKLKECDHKPLYSLDTELQQQTKAARSIQKLARRYLRRRRLGSLANSLAPEESLPSMLLAFMRNRAAKRIQFASRNFAEKRAAWRHHAYDANGVKISTPRALTPTATTKSRTGHSAPVQVFPNATGFDGVAAAVALPVAPPDSMVEADEADDEDDSGEERSRHVDMLEILQEDEHEEDQDGDEGAMPAKDTARSDEDHATKSIIRWGKKSNDRFVLGRQSVERTSGAPSDTQELRVIGALGQLDIK